MPANPQVTDEMVEKAALAIKKLEEKAPLTYHQMAKIALTAALADHVVVPREPEKQWTPPFNVGDRVSHTGRNEVGSVIATVDTVDVQFDKLNSKGEPSIGRYDENWFKQYPAGLVAAVPTPQKEG